MPGKSNIEWTDRSWNPSTGCREVSPGCAHCYAKTFAERWRGLPGHPYEQGFDLRLWPERLGIPLRWRQPARIFVNSMSDLFLEEIPEEFIAEVFDVMARAHWHTFQVLTKRHERLAELAPRLPWPPNVWMGVSIENRRFVHRADYLRRVPAAVRFISAEPLLGPLLYDSSAIHTDGRERPAWQEEYLCWSDDFEGVQLDLTGIAWLIAGGESGPRHRPIRAGWVRDLRDACLAPRLAPRVSAGQASRDGASFFFKQWGGFRPKEGGRELDGRTWDEFPAGHPALETIAGPP